MTGKKGDKTINIWVLPELNTDGAPSKLTPGLLGTARTLAEKTGGQVTAVLFSARPAKAPEVLGQYGVSELLVFQDPLFSTFNAAACTAVLLPPLIKNTSSLLLLGDTPAGRELAPYLAAKAGSPYISGCARIDFTNTEQAFFYRPVYGRQLYEEIKCDFTKPVIVTFNSKSLFVIPPGTPSEVKTTVYTSARPAEFIKTEHLEYLPADFKTVDVTEADTIVAAGMGIIDNELYPLVEELAGLMEGSIGATRPVIDSGQADRGRLIGQTGKTVSPDFYLALGISGATHHTG